MKSGPISSYKLADKTRATASLVRHRGSARVERELVAGVGPNTRFRLMAALGEGQAA